MAIAMILAAALLAQAGAPAAATTKDRPARLRAAEARIVEGAREAGDPSKPATKSLPSRAQYLLPLEQDAARQGPTRSFLSPVALEALEAHGCKPVISAASGVARADGLLNGWRTVAECGDYLLDIQENDYRQALTQKVTVILPAEAANIDLGEGRAMARYYVSPEGAATTAISWTDDRQELRLYAVSDPGKGGEKWNAGLKALAEKLVAGRRAR
ncbi:MAG: hypothetical protein QM608_17890 [Caulobacter sp.]